MLGFPYMDISSLEPIEQPPVPEWGQPDPLVEKAIKDLEMIKSSSSSQAAFEKAEEPVLCRRKRIDVYAYD